MQNRTQQDIRVQKEDEAKKKKVGFFKRNKRKIGKGLGLFMNVASIVGIAITAVHLALPAIGLLGLGSVLSLLIQAIIQVAPAKFMDAQKLLTSLMPDATETEISDTIEVLTQHSRSAIDTHRTIEMPSNDPYEPEHVVSTPSEDLNRVDGAIYRNNKTGAYKAVIPSDTPRPKADRVNGKY